MILQRNKKNQTKEQPVHRMLLSCFFRTYMVGANFNTRGMQNVGLMFALDQGLSHIYRDDKRLKRARRRYLKHYNTHPFWTPLLVGFFLFLESKIQKGLLPEKSLEQIKNTTIYTLSAIGDSFFSGALLVFWSLSTILFLLYDLALLAIVWTVFWVILLQVFKGYTFYQGWKHGPLFLERLKRWSLINWSRRIKMLNGIMVVLIWLKAYPFSDPAFWFPMVFTFALLAWLSTRFFWAREVVFGLLVVAGVTFFVIMGN